MEPFDGQEHGSLRGDDAEVGFGVEGFAGFVADLFAGVEETWDVDALVQVCVDDDFLFVGENFFVDEIA